MHCDYKINIAHPIYAYIGELFICFCICHFSVCY